jgi:hypothetical protein
MSDCVLGTLDAPTGRLYDARSTTRIAAARAFINDWGIDLVEVRCITRYARWLDLQEQWELSGEDRWTEEWEPPWDDEDAEPPDPPSHVPDGWQADEYDPVWTFCPRGHPEAIKVYVCEQRKAGSPASKDGEARG